MCRSPLVFDRTKSWNTLSDLNGVTWIALIGMEVTDTRLQRPKGCRTFAD